MKLTSHEVITMFYEQIAKDKYPNVTKKQIIDICNAPFRFLRIAMSRPYLPKIRMKGLGVWIPSTFRICRWLRRLDWLYENNKITRDRYEHLKLIFIRHIKDRIINVDEDYKRAILNNMVLKADEDKYLRLRKLLNEHLQYDKLVPVKEDDLKIVVGQYSSIPTRDYQVQIMVQQVQVVNPKAYSRADLLTNTVNED